MKHSCKTFVEAAMLERVACMFDDVFPTGRELIKSAYHLNGIFGNSGENSNGTVHPGGMFSENFIQMVSAPSV